MMGELRKNTLSKHFLTTLNYFKMRMGVFKKPASPGSFCAIWKRTHGKDQTQFKYLLNKHSFSIHGQCLVHLQRPMCSFSDIIPSAAPRGHNSRQQQHNSTTAVSRELGQTAWHQPPSLLVQQRRLGWVWVWKSGLGTRCQPPDSGQGCWGCALQHHPYYY